MPGRDAGAGVLTAGAISRRDRRHCDDSLGHDDVTTTGLGVRERLVEGFDALPEKVTRQIPQTLAHRSRGEKSDLIKSSYGQQLP